MFGNSQWVNTRKLMSFSATLCVYHGREIRKMIGILLLREGAWPRQ